MDDNSQIFKNSIKFLYNISDAIPNNVPSLKSYCALKSRILEIRSKLYLPQQMTKATVRCSRCCTSFTDYTPSVELKPKRKISKFAKKILKKIKNGKKLTTYQKNYSEHLTNIDCNIINTECQNCKNETKIEVKIEAKCPNENNNLINQKVISKKKKKKDKFCGLNESVVKSISKENVQKVPIKKNDVIAAIQRIKLQEKEVKKKPPKNIIKQKSTKEKIIENKKNKVAKKVRSTLQNLLTGSNKTKLSTNLKDFLQDL
ncbi:hypothetical protein WA026_003139 [Henosepilachna vigintioctopunctata]|uniref:Uncharacterized protein n=1 Tax=Henosepilachna vigintioctopunctata TaxID=420089 RepID=A0AAW1TH62_9CUCU